MPTPTIAPLVVSNEAFLVKSLIERCPKTMMLRELVVNAVEAASAAQPSPSVVRIGHVMMHDVAKLQIWNTGPGLSAAELDQMCDIASSIHKVVGLDGNFGMGAKVASLPSNQRGVIYRSCTGGRVHQVIMGCRDGVYGRLLQPGPDGAVRVIDVTAECRGTRDLGADWTEVVLVGNRDAQDTVAQPFDGAPEMAPGWIAGALTQRFFRLPPWLTLELLPGVAGPEQRRFVTLADRLGEFTRFESVPTIDGGFIHYCYMEGPAGIPDPATPVHELRGIAGIVYRDEIYGFRAGSQWALDAPAFGIPFGARSITIIVELPEDAPVRPEAYRQFLRAVEGDQHQVMLVDYAASVRRSMPGWLRDIIAASTPRQADYLSEVRDELKALLAELELPAEDQPTPQPQTPPGEAPASKLPRAPPPRRFQAPPDLIALHDQAQIDDRGLNGRAAQYLPTARQLYVNMLYPGVLRMALDLRQAFMDAPDQDRVAALATEVAEWSMLRLVARATIYSLTKSKEGWSKEELARAQSAEALTLVADNYRLGLHGAQLRLARLLFADEAEPAEQRSVNGSDLAPLRTEHRREVELATIEQAARRGLAVQGSPPGPFMRRLSEVAMRRHDLPSAINWARKAVNSDDKDPWSQHHLSGLLLSAGDAEGATQAAEAALATASAPPHPAFLRRMAELEARRKDKAAAVAWSRKAVEADDTDAWSHFGLSGTLLTADLLDEAEREARLAIDHAPQPAPSPFYSRMGDIYVRRGDRATALEWIKRATETDPGDKWAQFSLSGLLMAFGKLDEAATAARQAVVLSGSNVPPAMSRRLSEAELARRNLPDAVEWAQRAVGSDPSDGWSQHQLSTVLQRSGDLAGAATAAEAAVASSGPATPSDFLRRLSEVRREQGRLDEAVDLAKLALHANPRDPWSGLHLARLLMASRELDEAVDAAKQAIGAAQGIKSGVFSRSLSEIYAARKEPERALAWARKAVLIDETDEWSQSHLAGVLLSLGDLEGAERAARLALIHSSPTAMTHFANVVRDIEARRSASTA